MGRIMINTESLWEIGKKFEKIQQQMYSTSRQIKAKCDNLSILEDILQWSDEKIQREARQMNSQADRCGLAASYIFKMAENYEAAESAIGNLLSSIASAIGNVRSENDAIHTEYCQLSDEEKMQIALDMEFSFQYADEAYLIPYPGGNNGNASTASSSGCGAYAWLHLLRYYGIDKGLTIQKICEIAVDSGARPWSGGTDHEKMGQVLKDKGYDVSVPKRSTDENAAIEHLKNGQPVICSFNNSVLWGGEDGKHFISAVNISSDGKYVLIIDSAKHRNSAFDGKYNGDTTSRDGVYWMPIESFEQANSYYRIDIKS